jgi:hypothetical protein
MIQCVDNWTDFGPSKWTRVDEKNSTVILRRAGTGAGEFSEVCNVESYENPTLSSRNFK